MGGVLEGVEIGEPAYLGKPSLALSHAEAALLAVLPQSPSRLRPDRFPERRPRGRATACSTASAARVERGHGARGEARNRWPRCSLLRARWLAPLAAERLRAEATRRRSVVPGGYAAARAPNCRPAWSACCDRLAGAAAKVSMAALVVDNATLAVRAYAGSADFSDPERFAHVDMVRGLRSPGSALKPFLYALALDEGLIHSESLLVRRAAELRRLQRRATSRPISAGPVSAAEALRRIAQRASGGPARPPGAGSASASCCGRRPDAARCRAAPSPT
jgi:penicillin-binding protein 1C